MIKICENCKVEYDSRGNTLFCSPACRQAGRPEGCYLKSKVCQTCGRDFKGKKDAINCSRKCKTKKSRHYNDTHKLCGGICKEWLPHSDFGCDRRKTSRLTVYCKVCKAKLAAIDARGAGRFGRAKVIARRKRREWHISPEQYAEALKHPCTYCKRPLSPTGIGLDRILNAGHYTVDNTLPCCGLCNRVRSDEFSVDEMRKLGDLISQIMAERQSV